MVPTLLVKGHRFLVIPVGHGSLELLDVFLVTLLVQHGFDSFWVLCVHLLQSKLSRQVFVALLDGLPKVFAGLVIVALFVREISYVVVTDACRHPVLMGNKKVASFS
jgi:hypothetical protein